MASCTSYTHRGLTWSELTSRKLEEVWANMILLLLEERSSRSAAAIKMDEGEGGTEEGKGQPKEEDPGAGGVHLPRPGGAGHNGGGHNAQDIQESGQPIKDTCGQEDGSHGDLAGGGNTLEVTKKLTRNAVKKLVAGGRWANMLLTTPMISLSASWLPAGGAVELVEFCCAPDSNLTKHCEMENMRAVRYTLENWYDFDRALTEAKAKADIERVRPKRGWASTLCTTFSSLQNLNKAIWEKIPDGGF